MYRNIPTLQNFYWDIGVEPPEELNDPLHRCVGRAGTVPLPHLDRCAQGKEEVKLFR